MPDGTAAFPPAWRILRRCLDLLLFLGTSRASRRVFALHQNASWCALLCREVHGEAGGKFGSLAPATVATLSRDANEIGVYAFRVSSRCGDL